MLDSAREALSFADGHSRTDLRDNRMLALSLVKCIEIVGEAAARVSVAALQEVAQIPWQDIVGMRNRLIHAYYDIDLDRVWDTVLDDLPILVAQLEAALSEIAD
ncbi:MAG TPA: HepT-like ribonuclease domain-containing protein [Thermoanaerobaculia bacterium]|nr:HepT-like ribonuclease domain-containing protein [Thermoanaerobaculia bacterium]